KGLPWHGKVLAFGSPKFDKVIKKNKEGVSIPEEWKEKLEGKKTLMLNTSINDLLGNGERVLKKLDSFFTMIKDYGNIAVIWRPHPVLKATMKAMRPQFLEEYERLEKRFEDEGIGVLDRTPVIEDTIAISDGYIGSGGSSVINLFSILGKPVFIFDPGLEEITPKERRLLKWLIGYKVRDRVYLAAQDINGIFSFKPETPEEGLRYEGLPFKKPMWRKQTGALWGIKEKLYMGSVFGEDAISYDPVMKRYEKLQSGDIGKKYNVKFAGITFAGDSVFLFPDTKYIIMEYVTAKDGWLYHTTDVDELMEGINWEPGIPLCCGLAIYKSHLYVSNAIDNKVLKIYAGTGKYEVFELEPDGEVHNLIEDENQQIIEERARRIRNNRNCSRIVIKGAYEKGLIYMVGGSAEYRVRPWNGGKEFVITLPEDNYKYIRQGDFSQPLPGIHDMLGLYDHLITVDSNGSHILKISNETNELSYLAEEFMQGADEPCRNFDPMYNGIGRYLTFFDRTHILVQRERDSKMAIIDVENDTCKEFDLELPEDLFNELVPRDAGFDKGDDRDYFCMYESRVFPLENFLEVFAEDGYASVKERQMEAVKDIAANLDGTCGEKVHEYIMNELLSAEKMQHT
ncbi:MAG: hypothetical protein K6F99_00600, partial [Lachnospiraceae bacterium]|nr:hypothetical protein [Lachnospiraceae bacterium]